MVAQTITISKKKFEELQKKAQLFDSYVANEEISKEELAAIKEALKGPFLSKEDFLAQHPHLA